MKGKKREERKTKQLTKANTALDPFGFAIGDTSKGSPGPKIEAKNQAAA
jgi:hypothetical protein